MSSTSLRPLLSSEYIPFGSQYYRAPSPAADQWERDLENLARLGFNTVKFWVQWRWNHPSENRFFFDDIDELMDLAQKYKLRVMLNTIFDVAPTWIYRQYPDSVMITLDGRRIGPQTQPHRQIGGLGLCFNHRPAMEQLFRFLRATVRRYRDHPALEMWNVGSEPELTSSMAELRLYADDASKIGDMLCYCKNCQRAFKQWLKQKYGAIKALNVSWNRNYRSFADVEIPRTRNTFNDMIDWRMFFVHTLGQNVKRRFEVARREDKGKHALLCHHVFIQGFPVTSTANDPWNVGRFGDLHGFTQMDDPMMADVLRSCARGKPVISAEMLMLYGYTLDLPKPIEMNDIKRYVFTGIAANLKGFIFWQYRPELLGREAPAWGLTFLDGSPTPWLRSLAEVNQAIQRNASFLLDAEPRKAEVALLYNPENQVFAWEATGSERTATESLLGTHQALYERNFVIDFIHPKQFDQDALSNYEVIYIPFPYLLSKEICEALEQWVRGGGVLIAESYLAGWNLEKGCHQSIIPGYGLHRVFGVRQGIVAPVEKQGLIEIEVVRDLPFLKKGAKVLGSLVQEAFLLEGADVLAAFPTGEPAITLATYGRGKAITIGSYIGLSCYRNGAASSADLIGSLVALNTKAKRPAVTGERKVRVDLLRSSKGELMVIVRNLEKTSVSETIVLPEVMHGELIEQFTEERVSLQQAAAGSAFAVKLEPKEVKVYRA